MKTPAELYANSYAERQRALAEQIKAQLADKLMELTSNLPHEAKLMLRDISVAEVVTVKWRTDELH